MGITKGHKQKYKTKRIGMVRLSRTRLAKRSLIFAVFLIAIAAGAFAAAKNIKLFQVNAAESKIRVSWTEDDWVLWKDGSGFGTPKLHITPGNYLAYCVDPATAAPSGEFDTTTFTGKNEDAIKLAIYIASANTTTTNNVMNTWFDINNINEYWQSTTGQYPNVTTAEGMRNFRYIFMHIVVGYLYHEGEADIENRVSTYVDGKDKVLFDRIVSTLKDYVNNKVDIWLMAQNYKIYNIVKPTGSHVQNIVWVENDPDSGSIEVQKCDKETDSCTTPQGAASFSGIQFEIYNASGGRIYVPNKNRFYNNGELITSDVTHNGSKVIFDNLPLNVKFLIKESASTNTSYVFANTGNTQYATITSNQTVPVTFKNNVVRGDLKFVKTSDVDGEPMANVVFKIKSTSGTNEEHLVVTDENGIVDTSATHASHEFHTNGYDDMEEDEIEYLAYGTWFGGGTADDEKGALPYDTYEITELKCDANKFCYDIGDTKKTVTIKTDGEVVDLGEWSNDCAEFSITTTATDNTDGDKIVAFNEDVEIKDVVDYCLKKDMEFTIKGVVMNKNTKEPVVVDGKRVEQTITLTPESTCGTTEMIYSLNTKDLGGTDLVIFEELYYGDELILSHSDFDNASQTVSVAPPPPDTGAITKTTNGGILSDNATIIVFAIGGSLGLYASARAFSRKRFLNK